MAEIAESETDNQPDLHNGPHSNSQFLTSSGEDVNKSVTMETDNIMDNIVPSAGPDGDRNDNTNGPKYDDIKISKDGDNFVNIDTIKKPYSDFINLDNISAMSGESGGHQESLSNASMTGSMMASMTASGSSGHKSPDHKAEKDNQHKKDKDKEKEREERIRQQKEKLAEERQRKLEEMKEQQRLAQEKREKQLELRRMKIEELKRRDEDRRAAVEERRRKQESEEMARRESIIQKSQERITRFEQWKASGRKGGNRLVFGFGSRTPRDVCIPFDRRRSSSHTGLSRHSPNGSDSDYYRPQRRAVSACSAVRRHCCIDIARLTGTFGGGAPPNKNLSMSTSVLYNKKSSDLGGSTGNLSVKDRPGSLLALNTITEKRRSFIAGAGPPPTRPKSTINLHSKENVKLRERSTPRKPRPSSVATSMPSFMQVESPSPKMRSKSSDRISRDKPKPIPPQPRFTPKKEKDKPEKKFDPRKSLAEKKKAEQQKKAEEAKREGSPDKTDKPSIKITQASIDRLSAPKQPPKVKPESPTPAKPEPVKANVNVRSIRKSTTFSCIKPVVSAVISRLKPSITVPRPRTKPQSSVTPTKPVKKQGLKPVLSATKPVRVQKPIKQKGKENKETPAKDKKSEKVSSTEQLDTKDQLKPDSKPSTPTKKPKSKDGSPSKMQVSFDSSVLSSTDAANEQLFDSIEDQTLPELETSTSESSGKEEEKATGLDDSLNKDIEEIQDQETEIVAGDIIEKADIEENTEKDTKSPTSEVVLTSETEEKAETSEIESKPEEVKVMPTEPVVTSTPAKEPVREVRDSSPAPKSGTPSSKSQKELELEEYRAKLAEKRRQAREKAEREAELERQRLEQIRLADEERQRKEEEEQKRIEEEAERLAEEARRLEGERLRKAIEAEEQRKREEAERAEQEKIAREEAEKKQKEEAERMEKEKEEKIKKEEEERNERKKKLAAIMSKVKSDKNLAASDTNLSASMTTSSSLSNLNLVATEDEQPQPTDELTVQDSTPKFKSPLLQKLVDNKQNGSETPKFKSPLLQSLLGKKGRLTEKLEQEKSETNSQKCDTDTQSQGDVTQISADANSDASDSSENSVIENVNGIHNGHIKEMVDSSISMRTVDSLGTSVTDSSLYGSLTDPVSSSDHKFEQIIDLNVTNTKYNNSDDLLNCNTNLTFENEEEDTLPKPIIAFEDNATRRQEVADVL